MALIDYTNIENDTPASANVFNERFGKIVNEINGNLDGTNIKDGSIPLSKIAVDVFSRLYPVGSVYTNAGVNTNPSELLGFGTWEAFATGRTIVGVDTAQSEFNAIAKTGGHKALAAHNHTGSTSTNGDHSHGMAGDTVYTSAGGTSRTTSAGNGQQLRWSVGGTTNAGNHSHSFTTNAAGTGDSGNLQPYITVYMWKRVG